MLCDKASKVLFSGDNVLGVGTTVFRDLTAYMSSLHRMRDLITTHNISTIFPAHGPVIPSALSKVDDYIQHRTARIAEVEAALPEPHEAPLTLLEIASKIYTQHPPELLAPAAGNTLHVLEKLLHDGKAVCHDSAGPESQRRWYRAGSKL